MTKKNEIGPRLTIVRRGDVVLNVEGSNVPSCYLCKTRPKASWERRTSLEA
jgi:hypothetical protein